MDTPYHILVFPFYRQGSEPLYALLKRSDMRIWHGIGGGSEKGETPMKTAIREANEEAGIPLESKMIQLSSVTTISVEDISGFILGKDVLVIPEFSFGVEVASKTLRLSFEHYLYKWFTYKEAMRRLKWDSNKTALWELNHRIRNNKLENVRKVI